MIVSCPSCDSKYQVADEKVAGNVLRTRCKACGSQILVDGSLPPPPKNDEDEDGVTRIIRPEDRPDAALLSQPPSSGRRWTVHVGQEETQLMTSEDIVQAILSGSLHDDASVWKSGMSNWASIADIPELVNAIEAARRKSRSNSDKRADAQASPVPTMGQRSASSAPGTRTSKPPPPMRASVAPPAIAKKAVASGAGKATDVKRDTAGAEATGDLYAKIASKIGVSKQPSVAPAPSAEVKVSKPSVRPLPANTSASKKEAVVQDVKASLDPTAAPEDFYAKILAKVRPPKDESVPPPANPQPKAMPSLRKTLSPAAAPVVATAMPETAEIAVDIEIPIETDIPAAAQPSPQVAAQAISRRTSPAPPQKRQEPEVPIQLPSLAGSANLPPASGIVLPGAFPTAVSSPAIAPPSTPAAATNSVQPSAPSVVLSPSTRPPAPEPSVSKTDGKLANESGVEATKSNAATLDDHTSPGLRAARQGRRRSPIGTAAIVIIVGLLGVGGGVAATVYTLKAPSKDASSTSPKPSTITQAATPASALAPAPVAESAQVQAPEAASAAANAESSSSSSSSLAAQAPASRTSPKGAKGVSATVTNKSATQPSTTPVKAGTAPFNRDAALAVLGIAASQAASCKRPGGPSGSGKALVTFEADGKVVVANIVSDEISGTPVARCLVSLFQRVKVAPFAGDRQTVSKTFTVPQ